MQLGAFLFILVFLASILAAQLFVTPKQHDLAKMPFSNLWSSFLGMYQIFTGENWTSLLYAVTQNDYNSRSAWIGAVFIIFWFILSSIIILNIFIALVEENLAVPSDQKRLNQVLEFLRGRGNVKVDSSSDLVMERNDWYIGPSHSSSDITNQRNLWGQDVVAEFLEETQLLDALWSQRHIRSTCKEESLFAVTWFKAIKRLKPIARWFSLKEKKFHKKWLQPVDRTGNLRVMARIRKVCQQLVPPATEETNVTEKKVRWSRASNYFKVMVRAAIITSILLASITTPLYQRNYFQVHVFHIVNWFVVVDLGFAVLFTLEALIKILAHGWIRSPDACLRGWNLIDSMVVLTLWITVGASLYNEGQVIRVVVGFKAL